VRTEDAPILRELGPDGAALWRAAGERGTLSARVAQGLGGRQLRRHCTLWQEVV